MDGSEHTVNESFQLLSVLDKQVGKVEPARWIVFNRDPSGNFAQSFQIAFGSIENESAPRGVETRLLCQWRDGHVSSRPFGR